MLPYDLPGLQDAGVLQVKVSVLGIPDFTGYPTWVMLGKLFTYPSFGDVAHRVNLSSAVYAALAGYLEDPEPPGLVKAKQALEDGPVYILFPGKEDTPYYDGVETTRKKYQEAGLRLQAVDRDVSLYRVLSGPGNASGN